MATRGVSDATELGEAVRRRRLELELTAVELAADARVGRQWLVAFEAGDETSAALDMVWRLLQELGLAVTLDPSLSPPVRSGHRTPRTAQRQRNPQSLRKAPAAMVNLRVLMHAHPLGDLSGAGRARRRLDVRPGTRHRPLLFGWLPG